MSGGRAIQLVEAGLWLRMSGDLEGARRLFEQALRLDPGCDRARELLGTAPVVDALPEELQSVPDSTTNLFSMPLPRLFPDPATERPEGPTDPFIPLAPTPPLPTGGAAAPAPVLQKTTPTPARGPTPAPAAPPAGWQRGTPPPSPPAAAGRGTPAPARRTPLPAPSPAASRTPAPSFPPAPVGRGTPVPSVAPLATPAPLGRGTPLPSASPAAPVYRTPAPSTLPMGAAVPLPEPLARPSPAPAFEPPATVGSDDWWTDGVSTPAAPPKDAWEVGRSRPTTVPPSEATEGDALNLVTALPASAGGTPLPAKMPSDPRYEARLLLHRALELQGLDDHSGARELLQQAQALDPEAPEVARALADSEQTLQALYESKLGKLATIPRVRLREDEVIWLNLDHRAGFILAQIDGTMSFDDLFSVSGMSRLDTARILVQLLDQRVIVR